MLHTRALAEQLYFCDLRFTLTPLEPCELPSDLGSTLRGALGHALRDTACPRACPLPSLTAPWDCTHRALCAYSDWFEPVPRPPDSPSAGPLADVPRGFVLRPAPNRSRIYTPEQPLRFTLRLFGRLVTEAPRVVTAVARMALVGLGAASPTSADAAAWQRLRAAGARIPPRSAHRPLLERLRLHDAGRAEFALTQVEDTAGRVLWTPSDAALRAPETAWVLPRAFVPESLDTIDVILETPLWLRHTPTDAPSFDDLRDVALRRIRDIAQFWHGVCAPADDTLGGDDVSVQADDLRSKRWFRFSADQGRKIRQMGVAGTLRLTGSGLRDHLWWLTASQELHLGKDTVFGLGRLRLRAVGGGEGDADERHDLRTHESGAGAGGLADPPGPARDA